MDKTVVANLSGKMVNKQQGELLAMQMMKAAINGSATRKVIAAIRAASQRAWLASATSS